MWARGYLGGKCEVCGGTKDLEFHHKDRNIKRYVISRMFSSSMVLLIEELKKCQLLCDKHHNWETKKELTGRIPWNKGISHVIHGSNTNYSYGCRCPLCRMAHSIRYRKMPNVAHQ